MNAHFVSPARRKAGRSPLRSAMDVATGHQGHARVVDVHRASWYPDGKPYGAMVPLASLVLGEPVAVLDDLQVLQEVLALAHRLAAQVGRLGQEVHP